MAAGGRGMETCGGEVTQHLGVSGMVFVWGKPHSSKTTFLQALEDVTKVTCAFLKKRSAHGVLHRFVQEGTSGTVEPDTP